MIIGSLPELKALPSCFPDVSWIPSDICGEALKDFVCSSRDMNSSSEPRFLHLANPHIEPWPVVAKKLGELTGIGEPRMLSLVEFIRLLRNTKARLPVLRLLPYFASSLEEGTMPETYASLNVAESLKFSTSLASCPPIASNLLKKFVQYILSQRPSIGPHQSKPKAAVFLFGPWSTFKRGNSTSLTATEIRLMTLAEQARSKIPEQCDQQE